MDVLQLTTCGHVGKVQGLTTDRYGRDRFKFSLCCNFKHGHDEVQLWLQCAVGEPGLLQLCLERGVCTGEKLLITSNEITLAAALRNQTQTAFLNVMVTGLTFLTEVRPDALINMSGAAPRIMTFSESGRG